MTSAESLSLIVAIAALIVAGLSALASSRSAQSAEAARRALAEDQIRSGKREVAHLVSACSYEYKRLRFLAQTLSVINLANAIFAGGLGGSRHKLSEDGVATRLARADELLKSVLNFIDNPVAISQLVQQDIDRLQIDLTIRLSDLRVIAEEFARDNASCEAQMLQHQVGAISGGQK